MSTLAEAVAVAPDPTVLRVAARALATDRVWHGRLTGAPVDIGVWPDLGPDALRPLAAETAADWRPLLGGMDEDALARAATYQNSRGVSFQTPTADILDHVLLHASHHRGQANPALRAAGAEPPALDFITWVRAHP